MERGQGRTQENDDDRNAERAERTSAKNQESFSMGDHLQKEGEGKGKGQHRLDAMGDPNSIHTRGESNSTAWQEAEPNSESTNLQTEDSPEDKNGTPQRRNSLSI